MSGNLEKAREIVAKEAGCDGDVVCEIDIKRCCCRDAAAAILALAEPKWREIKSAPKDGTRIILAEAGGFVSTGHWSTTVWNSPGEWIVEEHRSDATVLEPALWLPLPPKEER